MFTVEMDLENPYRDLIRSSIVTALPEEALLTKCQVMEAVVDEIIATGKVRYGPKPSPEGIVNIRKVVCDAITKDKSINILVPWGSKKALSSAPVDLAEFMALKTLRCLNKRVQRFYPPGIGINLRVEDIGGYWLFADESDMESITENYSSAFMKLIKILELNFIHVILESELVTKEKYFETCERILPHLRDYLKSENTEITSELKELGWLGNIDKAQQEYYYKRYKKLYPQVDHTEKLARYFAGSWARYMCSALGTANWKSYFQLNFAPPVPNAPKGMKDKIINYRTIHSKYTRDHLPPWRAKGYFRIHNDNTVTPALTSWRSNSEMQLNTLTFYGEHDEVKINADYMIYE